MEETAPKNHVQEGKPRPSILPLDVMIKYLCPAYEEGILKYERESWRKGFHTSVLIDAAERHISAFFHEGKDWDEEAAKYGIRKHHLAGAIFSLLSILHTLDTRPDLDDRVKNKPQRKYEGPEITVIPLDVLRRDYPDIFFAKATPVPGIYGISPDDKIPDPDTPHGIHTGDITPLPPWRAAWVERSPLCQGTASAFDPADNSGEIIP